MSASVSRGWIGVDLDGTLAEYHGWQGAEHIGPPIPKMLERVKKWMAEGRQVRIFTARGCIPDQLIHVHLWLKKHGMEGLVVTNCKDFALVELWDDRAVQVIPNTGERADGKE